MGSAPFCRPDEAATPDAALRCPCSLLLGSIAPLPLAIAADRPALRHQRSGEVIDTRDRTDRDRPAELVGRLRLAGQPVLRRQRGERFACFGPAAPFLAVGHPARLMELDRIDALEPYRPLTDAQAVAIDYLHGRTFGGEPLGRCTQFGDREQDQEQHGQHGDLPQPAPQPHAAASSRA